MTTIEQGVVEEIIAQTDNCILVTDQRHQHLATKQNCLVFIVTSADFDIALALANKIKASKISKILSLGSGKVIDVAKFASQQQKIHHIAIPTCLSTNCFATDRSTLFVDQVKKTLFSKVPDQVIIDIGLIIKSPTMNQYGLIELLSSATALIDWQFADRDKAEVIDPKSFQKAEKLLDATIKLLDQDMGDPKTIWSLMNLLRASGELTRVYGCGRPVSGSEHILANAIENYYHCPHGLALYIGIQLAQALQHHIGAQPLINLELFENMKDTHQQACTLFNLETVTKLLFETNPRPDRFTCLDLLDKKESNPIIQNICNDIFK